MRDAPPDCCYPSDNDLGIPTLPREYAGDAVDLPVLGWGTSLPRSKKCSGTVHFYVDDYRFNRVWADPTGVLHTEAPSIIEVNYSTFEQMPPAVAYERIYKKRWLSRFWGSHGRRIFVDLYVAERYSEVNLLGVPRGWPAYATRAHSERFHELESDYRRAVDHHGGEAGLVFLAYGGGREAELRCRALNSATIVWINDFRTSMSEERAKKQKEGV